MSTQIMKKFNVTTDIPKQIFAHHQLPTESSVLPVTNNNFFVKPFGGLWTTPTGAPTWLAWCDRENFRPEKTLTNYELAPVKDLTLVVIDSLEDLENLLNVYALPRSSEYSTILHYHQLTRVLNFEKLATVFDGIWLTETGQSQTRLSQPDNLYGWDLESVLWFKWSFSETRTV